MEYDRFFVTSRNDDRLACSAHFPDGDHPAPLLVMSHGLASARFNAINSALAPRLVAQDIAVVLFDLSAHGESTGDMRNQSVVRAGQDVADVVMAAVADDRVDPNHVGLLGNSFSGNGAILAAGNLPLTCLGLKAPVTDFEATIRARSTDQEMAEWERTGVSDIFDVPFSWTAIEEARNADTHGALAALEIPVRIWQGTEDEVLPADEWQRVQHMDHERMEFVAIEGANHRIDPPHFDGLVADMEQFFTDHLRDRHH